MAPLLSNLYDFWTVRKTEVPENIRKVHKIFLDNRKLKLRDIADILRISEGNVFTILHESLRK